MGQYLDIEAGQAEGGAHPDLLFTSKEELSGDMVLDGSVAQTVCEIGRSHLPIKILKEVRKANETIIALGFTGTNSLGSGT